MTKIKAFSSCIGLSLLILVGAAHGQSEMMNGDMMMGGWFMAICILFGVLVFVALILAIGALLKYLLGKRDK